MPTEVAACQEVKACRKPYGFCTCCAKGHDGGPSCYTTGNPECPEYKPGLAFELYELERAKRHLVYN